MNTDRVLHINKKSLEFSLKNNKKKDVKYADR